MKDNNFNEILELLEKQNYASVLEISEKLYISPSTVRRTLDDLQEKGLIIRKHGGAQILVENNYYPSFSYRSHKNSIEKKKMAITALSLIKDGDLIFLDGSTTTYFIAEAMQKLKKCIVVTNGIDTLSALTSRGITAYSTGGIVEKENNSVLVGKLAENAVKNFHASVVFLSAHTVDSKGNVYDCFEQENAIRKAMIENSNLSVLLIDDSKFEKTAPYKLCNLNEVNYLISNKNVSSLLPKDIKVTLL